MVWWINMNPKFKKKHVILPNFIEVSLISVYCRESKADKTIKILPAQNLWSLVYFSF